MQKNTAKALCGLSVDLFLEGLADEPPVASQFSLSEQEASSVRKSIYADRIRKIRERAA
jgi:hypothetical protein